MAESEILVGQYLFRRLKEIGIETVFGVPGGMSPIGSYAEETDISDETLSLRSST